LGTFHYRDPSSFSDGGADFHDLGLRVDLVKVARLLDYDFVKS
jgi:hypothetical protein